VLGNPEQGAILQMWPHQCYPERKDYLAQPADKLFLMQRIQLCSPGRDPFS